MLISHDCLDIFFVIMISLIIVLSFLLLAGQSKELFISYSTEKESMQLFKYFHSFEKEFFVDVGAYDPIYASNTNNLNGWNGINIEASTQRHKNFMVSRPKQINLNIAMTDVTGGYATLVEYSQDSSASINQDFLTTNGNPSVTPTEEKVQRMTLADLCHQYYPKRPKFMNVDVEGHGLIALAFNDWNDIKCKPEIILVEHIQNEAQNKLQKNLLEKHQYSFEKSSQLNEIYVHKSQLLFYRKQYEEGSKLARNMREKYWFQLFQELFKHIIPSTDTDFDNFRHIDPRNSSVFLHFASQKIISIEQLQKRSKSLSNKIQPILLLHYNPLRSKLYFGSNDYTITKVDLAEQTLHFIVIRYLKEKIELYVLDHHVQAPNPLDILDKDNSKECEQQTLVLHKKIVNVDNYLGK